jgi:pimeloyl-ACP methyl ester carboxylesterase
MKRKLLMVLIPALAFVCIGFAQAQQPPSAQTTYNGQSPTPTPARAQTTYNAQSRKPVTAQSASNNRMRHPAASQSSPRNAMAFNQGAQSRYVTVDGMRIFCRMKGSGQPIILIHGYPLNDNLFQHQRQKLGRHYKVITPDLPGFGKSEAKSDDASIKMYAKTMFDLMDKLNIHKAVIGGHSMGGMTVIEMYKMHPDRFNGMILIDTAAIAAPLPRKMLWQGYSKLGEQSDRNKVMTMLLPGEMLSSRTRMHDKQTVQQAKQMIKAASEKGVVGGGKALANRPDNSKVLKNVHVPTLIIVGSDDPITPFEIAKEMRKAISGSKLAIIKGASHLAVLEKPRKVNRRIRRFMRQVHSQPAQAASSSSAAAMQPHSVR